MACASVCQQSTTLGIPLGRLPTIFRRHSGYNIFYDNIFSATDIGEYDHKTATHLYVSDFFIQEEMILLLILLHA